MGEKGNFTEKGRRRMVCDALEILPPETPNTHHTQHNCPLRPPPFLAFRPQHLRQAARQDIFTTQITTLSWTLSRSRIFVLCSHDLGSNRAYFSFRPVRARAVPSPTGNGASKLATTLSKHDSARSHRDDHAPPTQSPPNHHAQSHQRLPTPRIVVRARVNSHFVLPDDTRYHVFCDNSQHSRPRNPPSRQQLPKLSAAPRRRRWDAVSAPTTTPLRRPPHDTCPRIPARQARGQ